MTRIQAVRKSVAHWEEILELLASPNFEGINEAGDLSGRDGKSISFHSDGCACCRYNENKGSNLIECFYCPAYRPIGKQCYESGWRNFKYEAFGDCDKEKLIFHGKRILDWLRKAESILMGKGKKR